MPYYSRGIEGEKRTHPRFADCVLCSQIWLAGAEPEGGAPGAPPPPPKIGKNMIFWRKIVIFHTKYPKNFRASLRSASNFLSAPLPPSLKSWIHLCLGVSDLISDWSTGLIYI